MTGQRGEGSRSRLALPLEAQTALRKELELSLLSEIGARAVCDHLRRHVSDPALVECLVRVNQEGADVVLRVQELVRSLGGLPRTTSLRRRALARGLALLARVSGPRPVVRVAQDACETVSRWYVHYAVFLARHGLLEEARTCQDLAAVKRRHADSLAAFTRHLSTP